MYKRQNADFLSRLECGQCDINHEDPKLKSNVKHYKEEANLRAIASVAAEGDEYWGGELHVIFSTRILVILLQFGVKTAI